MVNTDLEKSGRKIVVREKSGNLFFLLKIRELKKIRLLWKFAVILVDDQTCLWRYSPISMYTMPLEKKAAFK